MQRVYPFTFLLVLLAGALCCPRPVLGNAGTVLYSPAARYALFNRTTTFRVQNTEDAPVDVGFTLYDAGGAEVASTTQADVAAHGVTTLTLSGALGLSAGFNGSCRITGTGVIAAVALDVRNDLTSGIECVSLVELGEGDGRTWYVPWLAKRNSYREISSIIIRNVASATATYTIDYYTHNQADQLVHTDSGSLAPLGRYGTYLDFEAGLTNGYEGCAIVTTSHDSEVVVEGFVEDEATGGGASTYAYRPMPDAGTTVYAPTIVNNAFGALPEDQKTNSLVLMNTTGSTVSNVELEYHDRVDATTTITETVPAYSCVKINTKDVPGYTQNPFQSLGSCIISSPSAALAVIAVATQQNMWRASTAKILTTDLGFYYPFFPKAGTDTSCQLQNVDSATRTTYFTVYDAAGLLQETTSAATPPGFSTSFHYQASTVFDGCAEGGKSEGSSFAGQVNINYPEDIVSYSGLRGPRPATVPTPSAVEHWREY